MSTQENEPTTMQPSKLVLGTAQLGMSYGIANKTGQPNSNSAQAIVKEAWNSGIHEFDTAQCYGYSERALGNALRSLGIVKEARIISKFALSMNHINKYDIRLTLEKSFKHLGVSSLFGIMIHNEEQLDFWQNSLREILIGFVQDGRIKEIGVSVYSPDRAIQALETEGIGMVQVPTNLFDKRFLEAGIFRLADEKGKRVYIRSVLLQGLLLMRPDELPKKMHYTKPVIEKLNTLALELDMTILEMAFGYIKIKFPNARVVFGAESSGQIKENVRWWKNTPSKSIVTRLDEAFSSIDEKIFNPVLWPN